MIKINIQLFGGRGANSGYGQGISTGGDGSRVSAFYDKTKKYQGMTIHQFENAVRDKSVEYIGLYDKDGKLIVAGTSNNKGAVAIPTGHPNFKDAVTLTHNHPYKGRRIIGHNHTEATMKRAKDILHGELAVALELELDEVEQYIAERIGEQ